MGKKIGENFARDMFRRGLDELREIGYFSGSNVAQPNLHAYPGDRDQAAPKPEAGPEQRPAAEHER